MLTMKKMNLKKYGLLASPSPKVCLPDIKNKNLCRVYDEIKTDAKVHKVIKTADRKRSLVSSKR